MATHNDTTEQNRIAIDLGACRSRFFSSSKGIVLDQPSVAALDTDHPVGGTRAVEIYGDTVGELLTDRADNLRRIYPVKSDSYNELGHSAKMLAHFLRSTQHSGMIDKSTELLLIPSHELNPTTYAQYLSACVTTGFNKLEVCDPTLAALFGLKIDRDDPCIYVDIGASSTRIYTANDNQLQHHQTLMIGGDLIDQTIRDGLYDKFRLLITDEQATKLKHQIGAATKRSLFQHKTTTEQMDCLSLHTNLPTQITLNSNTISELLQPLMNNFSNAIAQIVGSIDPHIRAAAGHNAVQLLGGGALLRRIDQLFMAATHLPVEIVDFAETCTVRGAALGAAAGAKSTMMTENEPIEAAA